LVYNSNDFNEGWDGKFKNKEMACDVYVYLIEIQFLESSDKKEMTLNGDVTLIR